MKTVKFDTLTREQLKELLEQKQTGGEVNTVPEVLALFEGIPDDTTLEDWVAQQIDTSPDVENLRKAMAELAAMEEEINGHEQERISNETQREEQSSSDHQRAEEDHTRAEDDHGTATSDHDNEAQRIINEQQRQEAEQQRAETFAGYEQRIETVEGKVTTMESTKMDCLTEDEFSAIFN